jgi:hypothetical protein
LDVLYMDGKIRGYWKPHRGHLSMKNSVSTFCTTDAPECTT